MKNIVLEWRNQMRIRFKPWARPELEASKFYRDNPEELKNKWIQEFKNKEECGHTLSSRKIEGEKNEIRKF